MSEMKVDKACTAKFSSPRLLPIAQAVHRAIKIPEMTISLETAMSCGPTSSFSSHYSLLEHVDGKSLSLLII